MKQPIRIPPSKEDGGYLVQDAFGERFYVYKGEWTERCGGFRWWIDAAHFTFEDTDTWCKVHCEDTYEACLMQIQQWEDHKRKYGNSAHCNSYITSTADNKVEV